MPKDFPSGYIHSLLTSVIKKMEVFGKGKKPEQIHALRVDIKKLRAAFYFLNQTSDQKLPKKIFEVLFKDAATLRDLHVNINLLSKFPQSKTLTAELERKNSSTVFIHKIPQYKKTVIELKNKIKIPDKLPPDKKIRKFFDHQIEKAKMDLDENKKENVHDFRTRIKRMMYIYHALPNKVQKHIGLDEEYIDKLQIRAGKWHDTFAAIEYFAKIKSAATQVERLKKREKIQFKSLLSICENFTKDIYV